MSALNYHTSGESHGKGLFILVNGMPAKLPIDQGFIDSQLARRQGGYGRGARQRIETDRAEFMTGVRLGRTTGGPITISVPNRDSRLDDLEATPPIHRPRPGHADLAGMIKWLTDDCRETLERASARETAGRVAAGALAQCLLKQFGIQVFGLVRRIGAVATDVAINTENYPQMLAARDASDVYCPDEAVSEQMRAVIRKAKEDKDTIGGVVECHIFGCPPGLGTSVHWYQKLDAKIAAAVMGIQAFKAVEIGLGFDSAVLPGSQVHDEILFDPRQATTATLGFVRPTNRAGGLEGGMTNGQPIVVRGAMKPIATLLKPLRSIDMRSREASEAAYERSDVCAVSAASVVMENAVAFEVASALVDKFGAECLEQMQMNYQSYLSAARQIGRSD